MRKAAVTETSREVEAEQRATTGHAECKLRIFIKCKLKPLVALSIAQTIAKKKTIKKALGNRHKKREDPCAKNVALVDAESYKKHRKKPRRLDHSDTYTTRKSHSCQVKNEMTNIIYFFK
jgi:hypothetical protein